MIITPTNGQRHCDLRRGSFLWFHYNFAQKLYFVAQPQRCQQKSPTNQSRSSMNQTVKAEVG